MSQPFLSFDVMVIVFLLTLKQRTNHPPITTESVFVILLIIWQEDLLTWNSQIHWRWFFFFFFLSSLCCDLEQKTKLLWNLFPHLLLENNVNFSRPEAMFSDFTPWLRTVTLRWKDLSNSLLNRVFAVRQRAWLDNLGFPFYEPASNLITHSLFNHLPATVLGKYWFFILKPNKGNSFSHFTRGKWNSWITSCFTLMLKSLNFLVSEFFVSCFFLRPRLWCVSSG